MRIAVASESAPGESRVALVPELVGKLTAAGYQVTVQAGAGAGSMFADEAYAAAGAEITTAVDGAEVVISVQPLDPELVEQLSPGAATLSFFPVAARSDDLAIRRDRRLTTFGMEYVPRISRAQSMDALSSQSLVAGYRGAIVAAGRLRQFFPLSMTAAGTVKPAQVVVLGAGVAGLQAIATCRRLGAVVKGYDVRAAAAEEIRSMGAQAIDLALPTLEGAGGYAREMTEERAPRQRELLTPYVAAADALITTAAVPGRHGAGAGHRRDGAADEARLGGRRSGRRIGRQCGGCGGRQRDQRRRRAALGRSQHPQPDAAPASRLYAQNVVNVITADDRRRPIRPGLRRRDRRGHVRDP